MATRGCGSVRSCAGEHETIPANIGTLNLRWRNGGLPFSTSSQHCPQRGTNVQIQQSFAMQSFLSKHDTLTLCWVNVGPTSPTSAQHCPSIGSMYRLLWLAVTSLLVVLSDTGFLSALVGLSFRHRCRAKPIGSNCWLFKWAATAFCLVSNQIV